VWQSVDAMVMVHQHPHRPSLTVHPHLTHSDVGFFSCNSNQWNCSLELICPRSGQQS